jgi:hypothetical protein
MKAQINKLILAGLIFLSCTLPLEAWAQCTLMPGSVLIDANDESNISGWLGSNNFRGTLLYRMTRDGNNPSAFHARCDNQGPTLVLIKNGITGQVFGGYNPQSWTSNSGYISGTGAFLFNLTHDYKLDQINPTYQTYNHISYGPTFGGGHDIHVSLSGGYGYNYPWSYENPASKGHTYLSGTYQFNAIEVEVYKLDGGEIVASGSPNLCAGQSVMLTAPVGDSYLWSTGETSRSITVNQTGDYSVQVSSANSNCPTINPHQVVTVASPLSLTISQVNASGPGACDGSVVLQPSGGVAPYNSSGGIDFSGTNINTTLLSYGGPGSTFVQNGNLKMKSTSGDWNNYVFTNQTTPRTNGKVFQGKAYSENGTYTMIGWHNGTTNPYYTNMVHAFYLANGYLYIFENGQYQGSFGSYSINTWYDFKIELMAPAGAKYYLKESTSSTWNLIYTSYQYSDTNLRMGLSFYGYAYYYTNSNFYTDDWSGAGINPPLTNLCAGTYEYTITDSFGCTATEQVTITEVNPVSFLTQVSNASCGDSADGNITFSASGGVAPYQYSIDGGAHFQLSNQFTGLITGTYSLLVKDAQNNQSEMQTVVISYQDLLPPAVVTRNLVVQLGASGTVTISPAQVDNGSSDACGIASYALDIDNFDCEDIGDNTVTLTVVDVNGYTSSATAIVSVADQTAPAPNEASLPTVTGECSASVPAPTAMDNCSGTITGTPDGPTSFTAQGTYTITWTYDDGNGNTSSQTQTVIVDDTTAPVADVATLPTITGECSASVPAPTATDNCSGTITGTPDGPTSFAAQGTYTITWTYDDGNGNTSSQTQTVIVDDTTAPVADVATLPTITGECSASVPAPTATDNCSGTITGTPDGPTSFTAQGTYTITWTYDDGNGNATTQTQAVIVKDVTPPSIINLPENISVGNDPGICGAIVSWTAPSSADNCSGHTIAQTGGPSNGSQFPVGTTVVTYTATDVGGNTYSSSFSVTVSNSAPVINTVSASSYLFAVNNSVTLSVNFSDTNVTGAVITWDDGTNSTITNPANTFTANKIYTTAGVYTVKIKLTDACGLITEKEISEYIVVYDPSGAFVTGGGWIESPAGASVQYPDAVGKANFGFVSKYQKGANTPTGNTEFQFKAGNLNFSSTSYQWLVVAGSKAQYKGVGTINGSGSYQFLITAIDGAKINSTSPDRFRIKITSGSSTIYDNQMGQSEDSDASTAIAGGSIVIHDSKSGKRDDVAEETKTATEIPSSAISVYPNPVEDVIYVKYQSESETPVGMQLIDLNGRSLKSSTHQANPEGEYAMPVGEVQMNSGFYLLRIAQGSATKTIKLYKK